MQNRQILLVEDEADVRYLAQKRLTAAGYAVLPAADGIEALHLMLEHPECRRMVTDFYMPMFGGNDWIRLLERFCPDWTIVVVSSQDVDPGPFVCVPKPVDYENLVQVFMRGDKS